MAKIKLVGAIVDNDTAKIYSWIGFDAISAKMVDRAIKGLGEGEELEIDLNSPGGHCSVGAEIYTMLRQARQEGHKVIVNVVGQACSAATVLMCAADEVIGSPVSYFMIHNASTSARGKARDLHSATECLEQIDETIVNAYEAKTGHSREELHSMLDAETWMSVNRAMEYGFVDKVMFQEEEDNNPEDDPNNQVLDMFKACATSHMIADDKLDMLRDAMIKDMAQKIGDNASSISNKEKGGSTKMKLEEVFAEHPEVKDEVDKLLASRANEDSELNAQALEDAILAERKRIQDISAIAGTIPEDMVKDAMFDNPCDAKELAYKALVEDNKNAGAYMTAAMQDSKASGAGDVVVTPEPSAEDESDVMAAYVNKRKGGK